MEKQRQIKLLSIIALVLSISAMTLGFAAFSTTLNISSSATVTPNSEDHKIVLSGSSSDPDYNTLSYVTFNGATAEEAIVVNSNNVSAVSLGANFTKPGQSVLYTAYVHNIGKYTGYFNKIIFNNVEGYSQKKVCTPIEGGGATASLVEEACESISITVYGQDGTAMTDNQDFTGYYLDVDEAGIGKFEIKYAEDGAAVDGPFTVLFGDVELIYSTVD